MLTLRWHCRLVAVGSNGGVGLLILWILTGLAKALFALPVPSWTRHTAWPLAAGAAVLGAVVLCAFVPARGTCCARSQLAVDIPHAVVHGRLVYSCLACGIVQATRVILPRLAARRRAAPPSDR